MKLRKKDSEEMATAIVNMTEHLWEMCLVGHQTRPQFDCYNYMGKPPVPGELVFVNMTLLRQGLVRVVGHLVSAEMEEYPFTEKDKKRCLRADPNWKPHKRMVYTIDCFDGVSRRWENVSLLRVPVYEGKY